MRIRCGIVLAALAVVCTAAPARAQWVASPYVGINLGGDAEFRRLLQGLWLCARDLRGDTPVPR